MNARAVPPEQFERDSPMRFLAYAFLKSFRGSRRNGPSDKTKAGRPRSPSIPGRIVPRRRRRGDMATTLLRMPLRALSAPRRGIVSDEAWNISLTEGFGAFSLRRAMI